MPSPTEPGVVLGTVGYMAPEQVRGLNVDHRADLFAFGAILYELLSGRRAFRRDTAPETMAAILNEEPPDLRAAERPIPPALARIVESLPGEESVGPISDGQRSRVRPGAASRMRRARREPGALTHLVVCATAGGLVGRVAALLLATLAPIAYRHRSRAARHARRDALPDSADGRVRGAGKFQPVSRRPSPGVRGARLGRDRAALDPGHGFAGGPAPSRFGDCATPAPPPFWSPDGRFVAFDAGGKLKKLDVSGGLPQTLCDLPSGVSPWAARGIATATSSSGTSGGLLRVRETGGAASPDHGARSVAEGGIPSASHLSPGWPSFRVLACRRRARRRPAASMSGRSMRSPKRKAPSG